LLRPFRQNCYREFQKVNCYIFFNPSNIRVHDAKSYLPFIKIFLCRMFAVFVVDCDRCPAGKKLFQGSMWCENIDECAENPSMCYYGTCHDLDDGYTCECDPGYFGPTCRERRDAVTVVVSSTAQLAIAICSFVLLSKSFCRMLSITGLCDYSIIYLQPKQHTIY